MERKDNQVCLLSANGKPVTMWKRAGWLGAGFACAAAAAIGIWPAAGMPVQPRPGADWGRFDRLIAQSEKAMMGDPSRALDRAGAALAIAQQDPSSPQYADGMATAWWLEAESLTRLNKVQAAQTALNSAAALAGSDGKITKLDGDIELARARIAAAGNGGNIALALKSLQKAYAIYVRIGNARSQSMALQGLGSIYGKAHAFPREIAYYSKASQVYAGDPVLLLTSANNLGFAEYQIGRYDEAIANYRDALKIAGELKSPFLQGTILINMGLVEAKRHRFADAERAADRAWNLLDSSGHTEAAPFLWGLKAEIDYRRGALRTADADVGRAFRGIDLATTIAPFRDVHEIAYKIYRAEGKMPLALAHLEAFKRLDDEGRSLVASANLALLGAQFDFATQQLEIEHLKSAKLERDISLRKSRAATQTVLFLMLFGGALALIAWIAWRHALVHRHRDAISRKNTELIKTLAERDHEIALRTEIESQLRLAMETAQQANRAKNHFLTNMSHELRTPLNAIIGFSELLMRGPPPDRLPEYAGNILDGGRHLLSNLNDVLDMARIEAGKVSLRGDVVALDEVVRSALSNFEGEAAAGREINTGFTGPPTVLRCDESRLRQVVVNLLSNAIKFTDQDGHIEIRIEDATDGIDLVVEDDGTGISEDKLDVILEPFGQAEEGYTRTHGGVGLGLPIAKALVEMHGGRFTLQRGAERGTIARVHLPRERIVERRPFRPAALAS